MCNQNSCKEGLWVSEREKAYPKLNSELKEYICLNNMKSYLSCTGTKCVLRKLPETRKGLGLGEQWRQCKTTDDRGRAGLYGSGAVSGCMSFLWKGEESQC